MTVTNDPDYVSKGAYRYVPMSFYDSLADAKRTLQENSLTALEFQTDLLEWLDRPSSMSAYAQFMNSYGYQKVDDAGTRAQLGGYLHQNVRNVLRVASTFYVSPDMSEIVKMAAEDMPATGLKPTDLPSDTGFLVFDRPVSVFADYTADDGGADGEVRVAAIAWQAGPVRRITKETRYTLIKDHQPTDGDVVPGISYFLFTTAHDMAVIMNRGWEEEGEDRRITAADMARTHGPLPIYDFSGWAYNTSWTTEVSDEDKTYGYTEGVDGVSEPVQGVHAVVDQARRLMLATWRILGQTNIVTLDSRRAPRPMRRRAERAGIIPEDGDIVIIRMRREIFQNLQHATRGDDDEPWYTCRFLVRGHWHHYWVGPRGNQTLIEKYILPYEKGPEGAPLVKRNKIISLER